MSDRELRERSRGRPPSSGLYRREHGLSHSPSRGFSARSSRSRGHSAGDYAFDNPMPPSETHQLKIRHDDFPPGKAGTQVDLIANFYKLNLTELKIYHYDVDIVKERRGDGLEGHVAGTSRTLPSKGQKTPSPTEAEDISLNRERFIKRYASQILKKLAELQPAIFAGIQYAYDGYKSLYSVRPLTFSEGALQANEYLNRFTMDIEGRPYDFTVKLKQVDVVDLGEVQRYFERRQNTSLSERVVSVYEIVLRFIMSKHYSIFQRKFFDLATRTGSSKVALVDFVSGFTSSVRMTEYGLALNMHLKTSSIVACNFVHLLDLAIALGSLEENVKPQRGQLFEINRFIRHLKFSTKHSNRTNTFTIDSLMAISPFEFKFKDKQGETSIAEYFFQTYGIEVKRWPLVKTTGSRARYLPLEVCTLLTDQFINANKVNSVIQRELLFKSTHSPNSYFSRLNSVVEKVSNLNPEIQREFGIQISTKPTKLQGRVLPAPLLLNGDNRSKFYDVKPSPAKWSVFCFDPNVTDENLKAFVNSMMERSRQLGLVLNTPCPVTKVVIQDYINIKNAFYNLFTKKNAEIVFVGIPSRHPTIPPACIYNAVKHYCDQEYGIISNCFKAEYAVQLPTGYFDNFLLKVNGKLGGINSMVSPDVYESLPFHTGRTMIVGIDVNHPSETERIASSIGAAVGSLDPTFTSYTASIRVQMKQRDEIISDLGDMLAELLEEYRKVNRLLPENIIILRDGVSDGEFDQVRKTEIIKVQEGINKSGKPTKITFIVAQKMHHTRFALSEPNRDTRKPTWNVPSGTVVDDTIVNPKYKMFYLNSHFSPVGTSRPTKYVILRDDLNMSADTVQQLCFILCHNNIRTRNVISTPTPVRYAHLCAYRSKCHIEAQREIGTTAAEQAHTKVQDVEAAMIAKLNDMVKISEDFKRVLYYC